MTRAAAALLAAAGAVVLAGCSLGPDKELRRLARRSLPPHAQAQDCEWVTTRGDSHASRAVYGCFYVVPGDRTGVASAIAARLTRLGFAVSARTVPDAHASSVLGTRGRRAVCANVLARGWVLERADGPMGSASQARAVERPDDVPAGHVFVDLSAHKLGGDQRPPEGTACEVV